jgi:molybdopterin-guanine dinucleotide biosynthesis protein A
MESRHGAVVLCGGESLRMGRDKAWLAFGDETMLQRVVRLVAKAVPRHNVVVAASADQKLPPLPERVRIVRDAERSRGPLPALLAALNDFPEAVEATFVTACDAPLLRPQVIEWLFQRLALDQADDSNPTQSFEAIVPVDKSHVHPLCGAYRVSCRVGVAAAANYGVTSLHALIKSKLVDARLVDVDELRVVDPDLDSLVNCNTLEDYEAAIARARG